MLVACAIHQHTLTHASCHLFHKPMEQTTSAIGEWREAIVKNNRKVVQN